jgi:TadE-like protein
MMMMMMMTTKIRHLWTSQRGNALMETAFLLPLLLLLGLGGMELTNLAVANMRVGQLASSLADNASRVSAETTLPLPVIREIDVNELLAFTLENGERVGLEDHGRIILSSLEVDPDTGDQMIRWQRCAGKKAYTSRYGVEGTNGGSFTGMGEAGERAVALPDMPIMFVEIAYDYQPLVGETWIGKRTLRYNASFMVRDDRDPGIKNPEPKDPVARCT